MSVIYKDATAGYEDAPITILQGHCDSELQENTGFGS